MIFSQEHQQFQRAQLDVEGRRRQIRAPRLREIQERLELAEPLLRQQLAQRETPFEERVRLMRVAQRNLDRLQALQDLDFQEQ